MNIKLRTEAKNDLRFFKILVIKKNEKNKSKND